MRVSDIALHIDAGEAIWNSDGARCTRRVFMGASALSHTVAALFWCDKNYVDGGAIGRLDPLTLQVTEYDVPHKGPRRMRVEPATKQFESTALPLLAANEFELPDALNVDKHGDVWIATNNYDRVTCYIPNDKKLCHVPHAAMRDLVQRF